MTDNDEVDASILHVHRFKEVHCFGELLSSTTTTTPATTIKTPSKSKSKTPKKSTRAGTKSSDESTATSAISVSDRLAQFNQLDEVLDECLKTFLEERDSRTLESVRQFIGIIADLSRDRLKKLLRLPVLVVRAPENVPDYDNLFDSVSRLLAEATDGSKNVLRFAAYPGGSLAGVLEQVLDLLTLKPDEDGAVAGSAKSNRRKSGRAAVDIPRRALDKHPLMILDELDSWPYDVLNSVLQYCTRHGVVVCIRCVHDLPKYLNIDTLARIKAHTVEAPNMTDAFNLFMAELFVASKYDRLPFQLSSQLFTFIRQRFYTCTHSIIDAFQCMRQALLHHYLTQPISILLRPWEQIPEAIGTLDQRQIDQLIETCPSLAEQTQGTCETLADLHSCLENNVNDLNLYTLGFGGWLTVMYKLNLRMSPDGADTPERLVDFYGRILNPRGRQDYYRRLERHLPLWKLPDLRTVISDVLDSLTASQGPAYDCNHQKLKEFVTKIDRLQKELLNKPTSADGNQVSGGRQPAKQEKVSWHQYKSGLVKSIKDAELNDPVVKLRKEFSGWWFETCDQMCGGMDQFGIHECFVIEMPADFAGSLYGNTKQAFDAACFEPEKYLTSSATPEPACPTSLALRVLCSLCEHDAGAKRKAVDLKQWYKQWHKCVPDRWSDDKLAAACFLACVGCLEYVGAVRGAGNRVNSQIVQKLYVPSMAYSKLGAHQQDAGGED